MGSDSKLDNSTKKALLILEASKIEKRFGADKASSDLRFEDGLYVVTDINSISRNLSSKIILSEEENNNLAKRVVELNKMSVQNPEEYKENLKGLSSYLKQEAQNESSISEKFDNQKMVDYLKRRTVNGDDVYESVTFAEVPPPFSNKMTPKRWTEDYEYAYSEIVKDDDTKLPSSLSGAEFDSKEYRKKMLNPDKSNPKEVKESDLFIAYLIENTEGRLSGNFVVDNVKDEYIKREVEALKKQKDAENRKYEQEMAELKRKQEENNKKYDSKIINLEKKLSLSENNKRASLSVAPSKNTVMRNLGQSEKVKSAFDILSTRRAARSK